MSIKIENLATIKPPTDLPRLINQIFDTVPKEHTRGISKVVIVDEIKDPRLQAFTSQNQPVLYHPKMAGTQAFVELGLSFFLPKESFFKRLAARLNFKSQVVSAILACIGQHYHFSYSHGIKKANYEAPVRAYAEKHFIAWRERNAAKRMRLLKPFQPYLAKVDKWMRKKMLQHEQTKKSTAKR